jgi:hypothetical protein
MSSVNVVIKSKLGLHFKCILNQCLNVFFPQYSPKMANNVLEYTVVYAFGFEMSELIISMKEEN